MTPWLQHSFCGEVSGAERSATGMVGEGGGRAGGESGELLKTVNERLGGSRPGTTVDGRHSCGDSNDDDSCADASCCNARQTERQELTRIMQDRLKNSDRRW
jgi:hypothetical protein